MMQQASILAEKEYLAYLSQNFAEDWRVTSQTSLFDYAPGTTTEYYTDRRFPMVHLTVADLNQTQQDNARARCQAMGIPADEMGGCIFDQGYLNIPPNQVPLPSKPNPTETVLGTINRPALHTNQLIFPEENLAPVGGNAPLPMQQKNPTMNREEPNPSVEKPGREIETRPNNGFNSSPNVPVNRPASVPVQPVRPSAPTSPAKPPHTPMPSSPAKPAVPTVKSGKG